VHAFGPPLGTEDTRTAAQRRMDGLTAAWTTAHHLTPWKDGGTTSLHDTALLCFVHHHYYVHLHGWTITGNPNSPLPTQNKPPGGWREPAATTWNAVAYTHRRADEHRHGARRTAMEFTGPAMTKKEAAEAVRAAKAHLELTWAQLAEAVGRPVAWTTAALLGQHPMSAEEATAAASLLDLDKDVEQALRLQPTRGSLDTPVPVDPTIYRFYEVLQVYGPTIKELIHEQFGDGIMSAINFRLDVRREADPAGDRVIVVLDGKFLPYQW
jgi:cyanate lyase